MIVVVDREVVGSLATNTARREVELNFVARASGPLLLSSSSQPSQQRGKWHAAEASAKLSKPVCTEAVPTDALDHGIVIVI